MAENIRKLFPATKNSQAGSWYNDTDDVRYARIYRILEEYRKGNLDSDDVRWFIKCAIINKIYISEAVYKLKAGAWKNYNNTRLQEILQEIETTGFATHKSIDIEKFRKGICFEHIVPYDVAIERLQELFYAGELSFEKFQQIRSKLNICLVTPEEDKMLNKYRQSMPPGADWENVSGDEFARYDKCIIKIYKR